MMATDKVAILRSPAGHGGQVATGEQLKSLVKSYIGWG